MLLFTAEIFYAANKMGKYSRYILGMIPNINTTYHSLFTHNCVPGPMRHMLWSENQRSVGIMNLQALLVFELRRLPGLPLHADYVWVAPAAEPMLCLFIPSKWITRTPKGRIEQQLRHLRELTGGDDPSWWLPSEDEPEPTTFPVSLTPETIKQRTLLPDTIDRLLEEFPPDDDCPTYEDLAVRRHKADLEAAQQKIAALKPEDYLETSRRKLWSGEGALWLKEMERGCREALEQAERQQSEFNEERVRRGMRGISLGV